MFTSGILPLSCLLPSPLSPIFAPVSLLLSYILSVLRSVHYICCVYDVLRSICLSIRCMRISDYKAAAAWNRASLRGKTLERALLTHQGFDWKNHIWVGNTPPSFLVAACKGCRKAKARVSAAWRVRIVDAHPLPSHLFRVHTRQAMTEGKRAKPHRDHVKCDPLY